MHTKTRHRVPITASLTTASLLTFAACGGDETPPSELPALIIETSALPDGVEGEAYLATISALGGTNEDFRWTLAAGRLPPGLFLESGTDPMTTELEGTPRSAGSFSFTVQVTDSGGRTALAELSLEIEAAPATLQITTASLPEGFEDTPYEAVVESAFGENVSWTRVSGLLPPGLELDMNASPNTTLSGTPTEEGRYSFTLRAQDDLGNRDSRNFAIVIVGSDDCPSYRITIDTPLSELQVSVPYAQSFSVPPIMGPHTWQVLPGADLPPGLALEQDGSNVATISGIPTEEGSEAFRLGATNGECIAREAFTLTTSPPPPPIRITTFELPPGEVNAVYTAALATAGGASGARTWRIASGSLPDGLTLNPTEDGAEIEGMPEEIGAFEFAVEVEDQLGARSRQFFELRIEDETLALVLTSSFLMNGVAVLPNATEGSPYEESLETRGGTPLPFDAPPSERRYSWVVLSGDLPPGLSLALEGAGSPAEATIEGTPTQTGSYDATIRVYDRANDTADLMVRIDVDPMP